MLTDGQNGKENSTMKKLLFETRIGDKLLALFERLTGLALVLAEDLKRQAAGRPTDESAA